MKFRLQFSLNYLLAFIPVAIAGSLLHWNEAVIFVVACIGIIPLAGLIGESTEVLAAKTGPRIGGLLNATLGNAAELIITIVAIRAGLLELVKASITGSILGNLLLVMGASLLLGGLRHSTQRFDRTRAGINATMLIMAVIAISIPTLFALTLHVEDSPQAESLSLGVAAIMIVLYGLGIYYSFRAPDTSPLARPSAEAHHPKHFAALGHRRHGALDHRRRVAERDHRPLGRGRRRAIPPVRILPRHHSAASRRNQRLKPQMNAAKRR